MDAEGSPARHEAREMVAAFVRNVCNEARSDPGRFALDEHAVATLYEDLSRKVGDGKVAAELVDRSLRYIAFFLADCGLHGEAMKAAVAIHEYRSRLMQQAGRGPQAWAVRLTGLSIGFTWDPSRVAAYAVVAYLGLVAALLLCSHITYHYTDEACIVSDAADGNGLDLRPAAYKHFYLAAVTLTTLGYGDVRPNLRHWWGVFPAAICSAGALSGYVLLAAIVSVIMNRSGIHPYARIADWMRQYENDVLGGSIPLYRWEGD